MDVEKSAKSVKVTSPIILISGEKALLVVEKQPVCIVPMQDAVILLMGVLCLPHEVP